MASSRLNWDDLRLVLALAEAGTLSAAAVALRLSHPTLSKRLRALEDGLGVRLFDRLPSGLQPTEAGAEMLALARHMADDIAALESRIAGRDRAESGVVRLTAPDAVSDYLLGPILAALGRALPGITVELIISNQPLSLAGRQADIALRVTDAPDPALKGRRLGTVAMAVYARRDLAELADGARPWVGYDGALACAGPGQWLARHVPETTIRFRANTLLGAAQAVRAGMGLGVLPCFVGGAIPELIRLDAPVAELGQGLWLLLHPELAVVPRCRILADALAAEIRATGPLLEGR